MKKVQIKKSRWVAWSANEVELLKKLYPDNTVSEIASQIGRSVSAVEGKAHKLGLEKVEPYRIWSKKEMNLLKKLYRSRTAEEIAEQLGRPVQAVRLRIFRLGLKKRVGYKESHRVVSGVKQKRCSRCKRWEAESEFHKRRKSKDGLQFHCKKCTIKAKGKSRKQRLAVRN